MCVKKKKRELFENISGFAVSKLNFKIICFERMFYLTCCGDYGENHYSMCVYYIAKLCSLLENTLCILQTFMLCLLYCVLGMLEYFQEGRMLLVGREIQSFLLK